MESAGLTSTVAGETEEDGACSEQHGLAEGEWRVNCTLGPFGLWGWLHGAQQRLLSCSQVPLPYSEPWPREVLSIDRMVLVRADLGWCLQDSGPTSPSRSDSGRWERASGTVLGTGSPLTAGPAFCFA